MLSVRLCYEVLQSFIAWLWRWVFHVGGCGVCVVGKMAKDLGTAIRVVVLFLPCLVSFFGIPSLHGPSFF